MDNTTTVKCWEEHYLSKTPQHIYIVALISIVLNITLCPWAATGNLLIIISIATRRRLQTTSNVLLIFLCLTDEFVALILQPAFILRYIGIVLPSNVCLIVGENVYYQLAFNIGGLSFVTLTLVSLERFFAIIMPFFHRKHCFPKRVVVISSVIWLTEIMLINLKRLIAFSNGTHLIIQATVCIPCMVLITYTNIKLLAVAKRHKKQIQAQHQQDTRTSRKRIQEFKAARTVCLVVCLFLGCYTPVIIVFIVYASEAIDESTMYEYGWLMLYPIFETIVYANSSINWVLYCFRNAQIREAVFQIIFKRPRLLVRENSAFNMQSLTINQ